MAARVIRTDGGLICECGTGFLSAWKDHKSKERLSSHLPPGETDPHSFCKYSHEELENDAPLQFESIGTRSTSSDYMDMWCLGNDRMDRDFSAPKPMRIPMGVLGRPVSGRV